MQNSDDFLVYITHQGARKGPFSPTMLRRMREDEVLKEADFTPEEWSALVQVLDQDEIRETSFWTRKPLVKIKKQPAAREKGVKGLLRLFTWTGFAIGLFFLGWGIIRSEDRQPWQSPTLGVAALFSLMIARTFVGRFVRKALLSGDRRQSVSVAYAQYYRGLLPLLIATGGSVAIGYFLVPRQGFLQVAINGAICFGVGAILSFRIPSSYFNRWRYLALAEIESYSVPWMLLPILTFLFLILSYNADSIPGAPEVIASAKRIVFKLEAEPEIPEWQFPVKIGAQRSTVEKALGQPERSDDGEPYYSKPGLSVSYNPLGRVTRLRFEAPRAGDKPTAIAWGVTDASGQKELWHFLGPPKSIMSTKSYQVCTWDKPPFRITAELWNEDGGTHGANGGTHTKGALKQLEIVAMDKAAADTSKP